jgi:hypothetical protein
MLEPNANVLLFVILAEERLITGLQLLQSSTCH